MSKLKQFIFILLASIAIASCFGILHDQVTYTISPEYYTRFKFIMFRLTEEGVPLQMNHRLGAILIGIKATWWVGMIIGLFYAFMLIRIKREHLIRELYFKTIAITFFITIICSVIGYFYGRFYLINTGVDWYLPQNLQDINSFICVGSIHNASYLGGLLGLLTGTLFITIQKGKLKKESANK